VQPVPATGAKFQVSTGGGGRPRWRRDGKELFYASGEGKLMAVPIKLGDSIEAGVPSRYSSFRRRCPSASTSSITSRPRMANASL
jgi:hypothetical protein